MAWTQEASRSGAGLLDLAPYSFFNAFNYVPPIIGFSGIGWKDSVRNTQEIGEFAWNLATRTLAKRMNPTSERRLNAPLAAAAGPRALPSARWPEPRPCA